MSTPRLIEGVSAALGARLATSPEGEIRVMHRTPTRLSEATGTFLNLFCYRTEVNGSFSNDPMPGRPRRDLDRRSIPPLALDLHYCLTAHHVVDDADDSELIVQRELARAMVALAADPIVAPAEVAAALQNGAEVLSQGEVAVRLDRENMSLGDLNQVWSAFQSDYHLAAFYRVSVALLEVEPPPPPVQPVLRRNIGAEPTVVASIGPPTLPAGRPSAFPGDVISLPVSNIVPNSLAWFGTSEAVDSVIGSAEVDDAGDCSVRIELPDANPLPLVPGVVHVRIAPPAVDDAGAVLEPARPDALLSSVSTPIRVAARIDAIELIESGELLYERDHASVLSLPDADVEADAVDDATEPVHAAHDTSRGDGTAIPTTPADRPTASGPSLLSGIRVPGTGSVSAENVDPDDSRLADDQPDDGRDSPRAADSPPTATAATAMIRILVTPAAGARQPISLVLTPLGAGDRKPSEHQRVLGAGDLRFSLGGIASGRYMVRLRADGVESAPDTSTDPPRFVEIEL